MSQEILKSQLNTNMYGTCHNIVPLGVVFIQHLNLRQPTERYSSVFFLCSDSSLSYLQTDWAGVGLGH